MSDDQQKIRSTYPLPAYNYRVTIHSQGSSLTMGFSEVSGLTVEYEPVRYKHGLSFVMGTRVIPGMREPVRFTLKKGVFKGGGYLYHWIQSTVEGLAPSGKRDVLIDLCDETGNTVIRWKVRDALPVKLSAPGFDASSNEVAIESLEFVAEDLEVDYNP